MSPAAYFENPFLMIICLPVFYQSDRIKYQNCLRTMKHDKRKKLQTLREVFNIYIKEVHMLIQKICSLIELVSLRINYKFFIIIKTYFLLIFV